MSNSSVRNFSFKVALPSPFPRIGTPAEFVREINGENNAVNRINLKFELFVPTNGSFIPRPEIIPSLGRFRMRAARVRLYHIGIDARVA